MGEAPISAIIPTYNRKRYLEEAIGSVLGQTTPPAQVIVVDDGSSDGTPEMLAAHRHRLDVVRVENGGKSRALNIALRRSKQPYVWIVDDDDIAEPDAAAAMVAALERRPDAGFAYGLVAKFRGDWTGATDDLCVSFAADDAEVIFLKTLLDHFIWQGATLVRRSAYEAVGEFDERYERCQDYEMMLRLTRRFSGVPVRRVLLNQRHHAGERGPRHARFKASRNREVWTKFNRMIFREIYATHRLEEFKVPGAPVPLQPPHVVLALIQRSAVMARKGLWDEATADLSAASQVARADRIAPVLLHPHTKSMLQTVFQHGARSNFQTIAQARRFRRALGSFDSETAAELAGNLLLPLPHRLRHLAARPRAAAELRDCLTALYAIAGLRAVERNLAARRAGLSNYGVEVMSDKAGFGGARWELPAQSVREPG